MSSHQEQPQRFPGRSDHRDQARIRRRSQYELPRTIVHSPAVGVGGQQRGRLLGFPVNQEGGSTGPFIREHGMAAARVLVQLAWVYAAAADRFADRAWSDGGAGRDRLSSDDTSTGGWLRARIDRTLRPVRLRLEGVLGWMARG